MEHAWLDSLSEDWVSQPGSDQAEPQLPAPQSDEPSSKRTSQEIPSRIPRRTPGPRSSLPPNGDSSVLSERSANEINISMKRLPSRLSQEIKREDAPSRTASGATDGSVVRNMIDKSPTAEITDETPEWKRRLLHGDMQYGEQRDLFCSAAEGLQGMFQPPAVIPTIETSEPAEPLQPSSMPSSPPIFGNRRASVELAAEVDNLELEEDDPRYPNDVTPSPSPRRFDRDIGFRLSVQDCGVVDSPSNLPAQRHASSRAQDVEIFRDQSCLSAASATADQTRKTSGRSDTRINEDFSPIIIGKHSDESGKVDFAPLELPTDKLKEKLEQLRQNQAMWGEDGTLPSPIPEDDELSRNLEPSEEFARNGGYINFRRGGRSADGSFRHRALSPPTFNVDSSEMLPEESLQASTPKQFPSVTPGMANTYRNMEDAASPSLPRAPFPSPEKRGARGEPQTGGSPLKLFGPYDTFTNQTLLRRISQFEEGGSGNTSRQSLEAQPYGNEQGHDAMPSSPLSNRQISGTQIRDHSRSPSEFGGADLEGYQFQADPSYAVDEESMMSQGKENKPPIPCLRPPKNGWPDREGSPEVDSVVIGRRKRDKTLSSATHKHTRTLSGSHSLRKSYGPEFGALKSDGAPQADSGSEGKRPRTSPSKDPTPKRRRTLHRSDIAYGRESLAGVALATQEVHSVIRSRSRQPSGFELANPQTLAQRSFLRPRTPSEKLQQFREQLEDERRGVTQGKGSPLRDGGDDSAYSDGMGERKPSIRTQDFVDQAAHIMAMIRNQVQQPSGLTSVEESRAGSEQPSPVHSDGLTSESTNEPLSRPPSREGKASVSRVPHRQDDPELIDRLKKYQEASDFGDVLSSSMRSLELAKDAIRAAEDAEREELGRKGSRTNGPFSADEEEMISDIPNIRITTNPLANADPESPSRDYPSHGSTARSYPTGSSRGSDSRRVIMPDSVSHLIPERVGSMQLDKDNNIWIKNKEEKPAFTSHAPSDSEDDPFASIPDLSVDLTKEMQNLRLTTAKKENAKFLPEHRDNPTSPSAAKQKQGHRGFVTLSPNGSLSRVMASSPAKDEIEKLQELSSGDEAAETEEPELPQVAHFDKDPVAETKRRNITISFSSPVASFIQDVLSSDIDSLEDDEPSPQLQKETAPASPSRNPAAPAGKSALKKNGHGRANSRHEFVPRPVSRIDEQDEDSTVELPHHDTQLSAIGENSMVSHKTPNSRRASSLSFMLARTPGAGALSLVGDDSALIGQNVGKLSLSPLSEFTVNKSDESFGFEVSYVMGHRHMETGEGSKKVMSITIRDLVDKLSEVEPYEPYWEDLTQLDLSDKRLGSLHMLDEFCNKVITLDASSNALGHLDGVPGNVRQLKVSNNLLTELTSWDHLANLQYVDISGNEIKSLSALKNLVHLRSIKADNNQLTSLDGLECHDGLLSLRARDNRIEYLDFAALSFERLTDLDVAGNQIRSVRNLEAANDLSRLKLSSNQLEYFGAAKEVKGLRQLDLSDNSLSSLDLSNLPGLHSLHADRNYITELRGFKHARRLDSLSLREQRGDKTLNMDFLSHAYEVRKLFLSGNYLGIFAPQVDFLNLQLLELANCGLQALPEETGQLMPNLRTLNLNFNAIADLSPLRFIPRLKKLLAAGNRLADSTSVTQLLTDFPHLTQLDLRDNPVTLGFYAPLQVLVSKRDDGIVDPFVLPEADVERDEAYARRLDEATKQRRRLHQIVFAASCKRLRMLDGLALKRREVLAKDAMLEALIGEGLLPQEKSDEKEEVKEANSGLDVKAASEQKSQVGSVRSTRWDAEDSFA